MFAYYNMLKKPARFLLRCQNIFIRISSGIQWQLISWKME